MTPALVLGLTLGFLPAAAVAQDAAPDQDASAEAAKSADEAPAREDDQKLSDRIKSVQRKAFLKKKRVEVFPHFAMSLNDPFFQHLLVGVGVGFHVADALAFEARGGFVFGSVEQDVVRFVRQETGSLFQDRPDFNFHADVDVLWAPLYGKISLFGEGILHFDTYLTAGPGVFGTDAGVNPALNFGIGQRYFITEWLVARVELRDYVFIESRNGESDIQNMLMLGFSVSGFFPTSFQYEFQ